tara:strand:+ start:79268 stop:79564 length:297 start_codon:yes stop_codon:yes gene_type:complete
MNFFQQATNFFSNIISSVASFIGGMLNRVNTDAIGNAFTSVKQTGTDATASLFQTAASYLPSNGTAPQQAATALYDINATYGTTCDQEGNRRSARLRK